MCGTMYMTPRIESSNCATCGPVCAYVCVCVFKLCAKDAGSDPLRLSPVATDDVYDPSNCATYGPVCIHTHVCLCYVLFMQAATP